MTDQKYPSREVFLNLLAAAGWRLDKEATLPTLVSPDGYEYLVPVVVGMPHYMTAWDYYQTFATFKHV